MKKKNLKVKLNLNKETVTNLNEVKGGKPNTIPRSECICVYTDDCYTQGDECCTAGTSQIICC